MFTYRCFLLFIFRYACVSARMNSIVVFPKLWHEKSLTANQPSLNATMDDNTTETLYKMK